MLSGRGLCNELITRPEESYRMRCVVVYDLEKKNLKNEEAMTRVGSQRHKKNVYYKISHNIQTKIYISVYVMTQTALIITVRYHHHISVMELGHLSTRSCLTYPEASSKVCHDSFCQLGNSVSLVSIIYIIVRYYYYYYYHRHHHHHHIQHKKFPVHEFRLLMSCVYIYIYIYIYMEHLFLMFLDHTQRRTTVGRTPLDE